MRVYFVAATERAIRGCLVTIEPLLLGMVGLRFAFFRSLRRVAMGRDHRDNWAALLASEGANQLVSALVVIVIQDPTAAFPFL